MDEKPKEQPKATSSPKTIHDGLPNPQPTQMPHHVVIDVGWEKPKEDVVDKGQGNEGNLPITRKPEAEKISESDKPAPPAQHKDIPQNPIDEQHYERRS